MSVLSAPVEGGLHLNLMMLRSIAPFATAASFRADVECDASGVVSVSATVSILIVEVDGARTAAGEFSVTTMAVVIPPEESPHVSASKAMS
jgi:hypothetical protein